MESGCHPIRGLERTDGVNSPEPLVIKNPLLDTLEK